MPTNDFHVPPPKDLDYKTALYEEHNELERVDVPIITVSASYRKELQDELHDSFPNNRDVTFSRAHYSMAMALFIEALNQGKTTWLTDPTNYITKEDWSKAIFTEFVGKLMARYQPLKDLKDKIDTKARNKLPISDAIHEPLLYLTQHVNHPILSLHYEAGRILTKAGKKVVQVITDPHVRPQYLDLIDDNPLTPTPTYCVFDKQTKEDFLRIATELHKSVDPDTIIITGPPVDPRIVAIRETKKHQPHQPLRLAITTSGLGTNHPEIQDFLNHLDPTLITNNHLHLFLYAGTHSDFASMYQEFATVNNLTVGELTNQEAPLRILYRDNIVDANQDLIDYMFPWADGIVTKPSGDMAYEAAAAGCFQLFLEPWGEWEVNIQDRFLKLGTAEDVVISQLIHQLEDFGRNGWTGSWFEKAQEKVHDLPKLYLEGAKNIIGTVVSLISPAVLPAVSQADPK